MHTEESEKIREWLTTLATGTDRDALEAAGEGVAASGDPGAVDELGRRLGDPEFLARLDDVEDPAESTYHLARVLGAMERHPSPQTAAIGVALAENEDFLADDDRRIPLLPMITAVRPMSDESVAVVRQAAAEGYYSTVIPLLLQNGSPVALALFEELIQDTSFDPGSRVADIHTAVLPVRTEVPVLRSIERLLGAGLDPPVAIGLVETIFDHRSRQWFGPCREPPTPPPWDSASDEALELVLHLAVGARGRALPPDLRAAVDRTALAVHEILEGRRRAAGEA